MTAVSSRAVRLTWLVLFVLLAIAPFVGVYPVLVMKALCFAIFACAFNLLLGFTGLLSFGHAAFIDSLSALLPEHDCRVADDEVEGTARGAWPKDSRPV